MRSRLDQGAGAGSSRPARTEHDHDGALQVQPRRLFGQGVENADAVRAVGAHPPRLKHQDIGRAGGLRRLAGLVGQGEGLFLEGGGDVQALDQTGAACGDQGVEPGGVLGREGHVGAVNGPDFQPGVVDDGAQRMGHRLAGDARQQGGAGDAVRAHRGGAHETITPARRSSAKTGHRGRPRTVK
ncbi:hypothetical protein D3C80_1333020 [compost metagenome]